MKVHNKKQVCIIHKRKLYNAVANIDMLTIWINTL
jgi:hypothetical protein